MPNKTAKEMVDQLANGKTTGLDRYEEIVEAWEAVVQENTEQIHLVTDDQASSWNKFKESFTEKIIVAGNNGVQAGAWDAGALESLAQRITGSTHKPGEELQAEAEAKAVAILTKKQEDAEKKRAASLVFRLKNLIGK